MNIPEDLKYTETHEWVKVEGDIVTMGITDYAQDKLGDVVFVEAPFVGDEVLQGDVSGAVESAKAVGDLNIPVSGEVIETNENIETEPELVNNSPYEKGWIAKIKMADKDELDSLLSAEEYEDILED